MDCGSERARVCGSMGRRSEGVGSKRVRARGALTGAVAALLIAMGSDEVQHKTQLQMYKPT